MRAEHLNFCRQLQKYLLEGEPASEEAAALVATVVPAIQQAEKFLLPVGGITLPDDEFRALSGTIRLPHPTIAMEYVDRGFRYVVLAMEDDDKIILMLFRSALQSERRRWTLFSSAEISNSCDRLLRWRDGQFEVGCLVGKGGGEHGWFNPVKVTLSLLNALSCSNVRVERSEPKQGRRRVKASLPFDAYHVLVLESRDPSTAAGGGWSGADRRSPREHLRRGHIRHLASGARIWVNATVVAPSAAGAVHKDYQVERRLQASAQPTNQGSNQP
jgi:hypothetical protein